MSCDVGEVKERLENELCYVMLAIVRLAGKEKSFRVYFETVGT